MAIPSSFQQAGFLPPKLAAMGGRKFRRIMIGTEGESNTGKTEFALSAPGPMLVIALDRNFDAVLDNPNPPASRCKDYAIKVVQAPGFTQSLKEEYVKHWQEFYGVYRDALDMKGDGKPPLGARTVVLDGDSDSWELQRLAEFGTLTNVPGPPGLAYTQVKAARRVMYRRAWDSGKIVIATNKVKAEYADVLDADGKTIIDNTGRVKREKSGKMERQGFDDQEYLWHIQIQHLRKDPFFNKLTGKTTPMDFGIRILSAKANMELVGDTLWGRECCFAGLVQYIYPTVPLSEWGF